MISFLRVFLKLSGAGFSFQQYYETMNWALKRLNNEFTMLHYPLFVCESDNFIQSQRNLTNYCLSLLDSLENKEILEIGCGNGIQALYIGSNFKQVNIKGIDLNKANIDIAINEKMKSNLNNVEFFVDDAQNLTQIPSNSIDIILNIESAFHYPDKFLFLKEVNRVLKPNGQFLIADILTLKKKRKKRFNIWGKKMIYHFWDQTHYEEAFSKLNLRKQHFEDITLRIIKAYSLYRNWLPAMRRETLLKDLFFRIFYFINIKMNVTLLRYRQQYCIYTGYKTDFPGI